VVAAGGTATAATLITSSQIKNGTIRGADVRNRSLTRADLSRATVRSLDGRAATAFLAGSAGELPSCFECEVSLSPSGVSSHGTILNTSNEVRSPNAALVGRDLSVAVEVAPGTGKTRIFSLYTRPFVTGNQLRCSVTGSARTCDSGAQTLTIAPGSTLVMDAANLGSAPASKVTFGWQATTP
jgi:hypothetical protein